MINQYLRHKREAPIFERPKTKARVSTKPKALSSVQLPGIFTRQLRQKIPEVSLSNPNDVRREIGKVVSFKKDKITCLLPEMFDQLPEEIKAVGYQSSEYVQKLAVVNKILSTIDLSLKEKDAMIARGKKSQASYVFFTNFSYHPQSLCCNSPVILKCNDKRGIQSDDLRQASRKWYFLCLGCLKTLMRINETEQKPKNQQQNFTHKLKLLDFALHIASGRYKQHLLEDQPSQQSFEHIKSRFTHVIHKKQMESLQ